MPFEVMLISMPTDWLMPILRVKKVYFAIKIFHQLLNLVEFPKRNLI